MNSWLVLGIFIVSALIQGVMEWTDRGREKKLTRIYRFARPATILLAIVGAILSYRSGIASSTKIENAMNRTLVECGDTVALDEFLRGQAQINRLLAKPGLADWGESLDEAVLKMREQAAILGKQSSDATVKYRARWEPLFGFVVSVFDERVDFLKQRDPSISYEPKPLDIVSNISPMTVARDYVIASNSRVRLVLVPAQIQAGTVVRDAELYGTATLDDVALFGFKLYLRRDDGTWTTMIAVDRKLGPAQEYFKTTSDTPRDDPELQKAVVDVATRLLTKAVAAAKTPEPGVGTQSD